MGPMGTPVKCTSLNVMPLWVRKPSQYVSRHAGQLSLAITPWWARADQQKLAGIDRVNRHTARCNIPVLVVS